jgi:hypothetical protein
MDSLTKIAANRNNQGKNTDDTWRRASLTKPRKRVMFQFR